MKKRLKEALGAVLRNADTLICFEVIYRMIGYGWLFPELRAQLDSLPVLLGLQQTGQQDVGQLLRSPLALLLLIGTLLLLAFYLLFEVAALLLYCEAGWQRRRISLWAMCRGGFARTAGLFRPKRIAVLSLTLPLLLSVFSLMSGWLQTVRIPEFVMEYISGAPWLLALYAALVLGSNLVLFGFLFGMPALLLQGASFARAWRESLRLLRGKKLKTAGKLLLLAALLTGAVLFAAAAAVLLLAGYDKLLYPPAQARVRFQFSFVMLRRAQAVTAGAVAAVLLCAAIIVLYHAYRGEARAAAPKRGGEKKGRVTRFLKRGVFVLLAAVLLTVASETELGGAFPSDETRKTQIVAHRAGGLFAPENTVAALENAIRDGADIAEIDVQRLRDGTLAILHDTNFRRTAGADLPARDAVWADVRALDAGSHFSAAYAGEPVPRLEDMLRAAKDRIGLMIELKSTGDDEALTRDTLAQIQGLGMERQCSIASMDLSILKRVRELAPEMQTVYISALLFSDRYDLPYVDGYSVETGSLSFASVAQAHAQAKKVYGWTANSARTLHQLLRYGVDGLITDNAGLAAYCIETTGRDLWVDDLTELLFGPADQVPMEYA